MTTGTMKVDYHGSASAVAGQTAPLPTSLPLVTAAGMAVITVATAAFAGSTVAPLVVEQGQWIVALLFGAAVFLALAIPLWRAQRADADRKSAWRSAQYVRARHRAADARHHAFTAMGMAGFLLPCLAILTFITINDAIVYKTFLRGEIIYASLGDISRAFLVNITIALSAQLLSMALGLILAMGRLLQGPSFALVRGLCTCYVDIFRSLPAIVIIYLVCFGVPLMGIPVISEGNPMFYAIIALSLTYAAYNGEQFRAGIQGIHHSQISAAQSLGIPAGSIFRLVILPQALRRIAGPMLGNFIALQKDTALVNIVGIVDAFTQAKIYSANFYNLSSITVVCILFIVITIPQTRLVDYLVSRADNKRSR